MQSLYFYLQRALVAAFLAIGVASSTHAAVTITLDPFARGTYNHFGSGTRSESANYFAGYIVGFYPPPLDPLVFRNYFMFDVGRAIDTFFPSAKRIIAATLVIDNWNTHLGFAIPPEAEWGGSDIGYWLYDVTTPPGDFHPGTTSTAIFNDLGPGTAYYDGGFVVREAGNRLVIHLNDAALLELNSDLHDNVFIVGGSIDNFGIPHPFIPSVTTGLFGGSGSDPFDGHSFNTQLIIAVVPAPSTLLLLAVGFVGFLVQRRKQSNS